MTWFLHKKKRVISFIQKHSSLFSSFSFFFFQQYNSNNRNMTCSDTLTVDNIKDHLVNDTKIKVAAVDIDGVLRGKVMHKDKFLSIVEGGFGNSYG
jgi:hypothetical protein